MDEERLTSELNEVCKNFDVTLLITEPQEYHEVNIAVIRLLHEEKGLPGVYVTGNKPYQTMVEFFEDEGIDTEDIFFIDAISKEIGGGDEERENVVFMDNPRNLTSLSIAISQAQGNISGKKFVFVDSLSDFSLYNNSDVVLEFSHHLTGKMQRWGVAGIIVAVQENVDEEVISHMRRFADRVIEV